MLKVKDQIASGRLGGIAWCSFVEGANSVPSPNISVNLTTCTIERGEDMATQLMPLPCKQEQQMSQTMQSQQTQHGSLLCQFPVMAPRSWHGVGSPSSSPAPSLYHVHNKSGGEGTKLSHGVPSPATTAPAPADGDVSWEVRAFAEDSASCSGQWPPRSYTCSFCRREFRTAQALGGHMNVHRRERAQANNMAILRSSAQQIDMAMLRSSAQQTAAVATAAATPQQFPVIGPQTPWGLYTPMNVNPAAIASPEKREFFSSSLAPGEAIIAMTSSSGNSSQFTSSSSPRPSPSHYNDNGANEKPNDAGVLNSAKPSSSQFSNSPLSSPISQGSRSSGSSVVTFQGVRGGGEGGRARGSSYRNTSFMSGDSASLAHKVQLFQPHQPSAFEHEPAPLVTQELIQLRPQCHNSTIISKSMLIKGPADDVGFLDLELRLGPAW